MKHEAKAPPGWGEEAMQHLKKEYKGGDSAAFGTAWTLHKRGVSGDEYLEGKKSVLNCAVKTAVDELFGKKANGQVPRMVGAITDILSEMESVAASDWKMKQMVGGYIKQIQGYLRSILEVEEEEMESGLMAASRKGE